MLWQHMAQPWLFPLCPPALVLLLLAVAVTACGRRHHMKKGAGLLVGESEDDVRDNVFNYDEQGGGEEDEVCVFAFWFHCLEEVSG